MVSPGDFTQAVAILCALISDTDSFGGHHVVIYAESSILVSALNKGREKCCGFTAKVIEAIYRLASELHPFPTFAVRPAAPLGLAAPTKTIPRPVASWLNHLRPTTDLGASVLAYVKH